jgi:hypothetical protein
MEEKWYEYSMEEAIFRGTEGYKKGSEKFQRTSVMMPQIVRIGIESIQDGYNGLSQRYILYQLVEHGHSILQHNHWHEIEEVGKARKSLAFPKVKDIRNFMHEIKTVIDGMEKLQRREVRMQGDTLSSLIEMSRIVGIEQSSLIRLCMYYSITTSKEIHPEMLEVAETEVAIFKDHLKRRKVLYIGFVHIEELWEEDKKGEEGDI